MTYIFNEKLIGLEPYSIDSMEYDVKLDANENFIDPGEDLKGKLQEAWNNIPLNRYPDNSYLVLRQAFGDYYQVNADRVVAGNGSDELISMIIGTFLKNDDSILLSSPDFSMYPIFVSYYERKNFVIKRDDFGNLDVDAVLKTIKDSGATAFIFSNPSSALSTVMKREKVLEIVDNTDALVIVDEAYMDFSDQSVIQEAEERDNLVVLRTCSKAIGCAGIRLGFAVSSKNLTDILNALRPPYNLNTITEATGRVVLTEKKYINESINKVLKNRNQLYSELKNVEDGIIISRIYPTETNYICVKTIYADKIYEELKKRSILVRSFKNMLRITVGNVRENRTLISAMKSILKDDIVNEGAKT